MEGFAPKVGSTNRGDVDVGRGETAHDDEKSGGIREGTGERERQSFVKQGGWEEEVNRQIWERGGAVGDP